MNDLISRQAAIDALHMHLMYRMGTDSNKKRLDDWINSLPSAQPEIKPIEYRDCADAMLKMWIDNVVTDGEYNRIMDKLNAHWGKNNG
jgi:hypothetical protein